MNLNEKDMNYKILDFCELYNFIYILFIYSVGSFVHLTSELGVIWAEHHSGRHTESCFLPQLLDVKWKASERWKVTRNFTTASQRICAGLRTSVACRRRLG